MSNFYECFTHVDDLRNMEPEYYTRGTCSTAQNESVPCEDVVTLPSKTPVMLLDEGSKRIYGQAPEYHLISETMNGNVANFVMVCRLSGSESSGSGKNKKSAKHVAAAEMLRIMVKKNIRYAKDMGIPSSSVDEALKYIDAIVEPPEASVSPTPSGESDAQFDPAANYVGKVQEICMRTRLSTAIYESTEEGPPNDRTFITICKVAKKETEGRAKQKKASKTLAAFKMSCILEKSLKEMNEDMDLENAGDNDSEMKQREIEKRCEDVKDPIKGVEEALSDESKFTKKKIEYRILDSPCSFGLKQCMLKIVICKNSELENTYIYPGAGDTDDEARNSAARMALIHILAL